MNNKMIRKMLKEKLTITELTERTGLSRSTISRIVNGWTYPQAVTQHILCDALDATPKQLGF